MGARIGLLAALAYAVLPFVVVQNRFGYTYNGLAFWTALALLALLRARRDAPRWAIVAGLADRGGPGDRPGGRLPAPRSVLGLRGASPWRRLGVLALALLGPALYLGAMALSDRATLLFDITHTAGRVSGGPLAMQAVQWLYNLADLMRIDPAIPCGLAGLALIPCRSGRRRVLGLLALMLLVILKVRDPNPLFRTAEPLLPLACLGLGVLGARLWAASEAAARRASHPGLASAALVAVLLAAAGRLRRAAGYCRGKQGLPHLHRRAAATLD